MKVMFQTTNQLRIGSRMVRSNGWHPKMDRNGQQLFRLVSDDYNSPGYDVRPGLPMEFYTLGMGMGHFDDHSPKCPTNGQNI